MTERSESLDVLICTAAKTLVRELSEHAPVISQEALDIAAAIAAHLTPVEMDAMRSIAIDDGQASLDLALDTRPIDLPISVRLLAVGTGSDGVDEFDYVSLTVAGVVVVAAAEPESPPPSVATTEEA